MPGPIDGSHSSHEGRRSCSAPSSASASRHSGQRLLRCVHASDDRTFCDTENVLLCNVGMPVFTPLVRAGLVFERSFDVPLPPTGEPFAHHHSYSFSESDAPENWATPRAASRWTASAVTAVERCCVVARRLPRGPDDRTRNRGPPVRAAHPCCARLHGDPVRTEADARWHDRGAALGSGPVTSDG